MITGWTYRFGFAICVGHWVLSVGPCRPKSTQDTSDWRLLDLQRLP